MGGVGVVRMGVVVMVMGVRSGSPSSWEFNELSISKGLW